MNLTCVCNQCQRPPRTFRNNQTCMAQYGAGAACNSSDQCRNDLQLVCSRINKTCISPTPRYINVINASIPAKFSGYGRRLNWTGMEWWKAFDKNTSSYWNSDSNGTDGPDAIYLTLDDQYLLTSFQLTVFGDTTHDPRAVEYYFDENGTCLADNFTFPTAPSSWYTFPLSSFTYRQKPFVAKQILINFWRWSFWQVCVAELQLFGIPY